MPMTPKVNTLQKMMTLMMMTTSFSEKKKKKQTHAGENEGSRICGDEKEGF